MFCGHCGSSTINSQQFCTHCGFGKSLITILPKITLKIVVFDVENERIIRRPADLIHFGD